MPHRSNPQEPTMNTSHTHRFASFALAAIVTVAMLFGVNQMAASTSASSAQLAAAATTSQA
jgi:hypothetical protein